MRVHVFISPDTGRCMRGQIFAELRKVWPGITSIESPRTDKELEVISFEEAGRIILPGECQRAIVMVLLKGPIGVSGIRIMSDNKRSSDEGGRRVIGQFWAKL